MGKVTLHLYPYGNDLVGKEKFMMQKVENLQINGFELKMKGIGSNPQIKAQKH